MNGALTPSHFCTPLLKQNGGKAEGPYTINSTVMEWQDAFPAGNGSGSTKRILKAAAKRTRDLALEVVTPEGAVENVGMRLDTPEDRECWAIVSTPCPCHD